MMIKDRAFVFLVEFKIFYFYIFRLKHYKKLNSQMLAVQRAHDSVTREVSRSASLLRRYATDALLFLTITTGPE